jgi:acyl-CoA dehydrogenase
VTLLLLGGALKRREKLSGRFADVLGEMYLMSAVLKHFEDQDRHRGDAPLLEAVCRNALYRIEQQLGAVLDNFPSRPLAWLLRRILFPFGRRARAPSDALSRQVAAQVLEPCAARDRLTAGMYLNPDPADPIGRLEHALDLTLKADPIEKRLRQAINEGQLAAGQGGVLFRDAAEAGIIEEAEAALLEEAAAAVRKAIDVDDFEAGALRN